MYGRAAGVLTPHILADGSHLTQRETALVLINLGVNEMQTVANLKGSTETQTEVNRKGLADLRRYAAAFEGHQLKRGAEGAIVLWRRVPRVALAFECPKRLSCRLGRHF